MPPCPLLSILTSGELQQPLERLHSQFEKAISIYLSLQNCLCVNRITSTSVVRGEREREEVGMGMGEGGRDRDRDEVFAIQSFSAMKSLSSFNADENIF